MFRGRDRNYLFTDGDLGDSLRHHFAQAIHAVDQIPEERFKAASDAEIAAEVHAQYAIAPIELMEDQKTMSRSEVKIDVSRNFERNPFRDPGPIYANGVRVAIAIPFRGEAGLWRLRPSTYTTVFPRADVRGGVLEIVLEQPTDEPPERIKERLDAELKNIRSYLGWQASQIADETRRLPEALRSAITNRRRRLAAHDTLSDILGIPENRNAATPTERPKPTSVTHEKTVKGARPRSTKLQEWDVFISHASEDKDAIARPLAEALMKAGYRVWFDEFALTVGDSLRQSIEKGLAKSRFGVVIISPRFLEKHWPQRELDGLAAREVDGRKVILPVWHNIDRQTIADSSPMLADRLATESAKGVDRVAADLKAAIDRD